MAEKLVYLAGPIRGHDYDGAEAWRAHAAMVLWRSGIVGLSPMRGKHNLKAAGRLEGPTGTGLATPEDNPLTGERAIFRRDRWDVRRSNLVLANFEETAIADHGMVLDNLGFMSSVVCEIASLGTAMEIAWADAYGVPVVAVIPKGNIHDHPLIRHGCLAIVTTLDEALDLIPTILGVSLWRP